MGKENPKYELQDQLGSKKSKNAPQLDLKSVE